MAESKRRAGRVSVVNDSLKIYYLGRIMSQTPHCMRDYRPQHIARKINRGHESAGMKKLFLVQRHWGGVGIPHS